VEALRFPTHPPQDTYLSQLVSGHPPLSFATQLWLALSLCHAHNDANRQEALGFLKSKVKELKPGSALLASLPDLLAQVGPLP